MDPFTRLVEVEPCRVTEVGNGLQLQYTAQMQSPTCSHTLHLAPQEQWQELHESSP